MSDTNPAVDPPEQEKPKRDIGEDNRSAAEIGTAPALQRRDSGGADVMS